MVPVDPGTGDVLLVDHRNARLWLPPGGHVEPGEAPAVTAGRELAEELGVSGAATLNGRGRYLLSPLSQGFSSALSACSPAARSAGSH
ncbi:NUDIX domain-containing protein [Actinoplanes sp. NPDC049316]|uniref:NUDIX domain-containing protein n=1 Tax=Actinoplanes sp. NPDC049316 TaxID=3154727 RepID=UPI00344111AF